MPRTKTAPLQVNTSRQELNFKSASEYMNLQFKVKWLFKEYVSTLPEYESQPPEYPTLFEPFTLDWLEENESISLKFLHGAYEVLES